MSHIDIYIQELKQNTLTVKDRFGTLSIEILYAKPSPSSWSVAENLDHLITLNSSYFSIFKKLKSGTFQAAFVSKISFFPKILGNMIMKSVDVNNSKKVKTFPQWQPKVQADSKVDIIRKFEKHQAELIKYIKEMENFIEKGTIIHSPANKLIVYSLEQAIEIIIEHEKRHINQAELVWSQIKDKEIKKG
ncbi:DinB family protein [Belliella kenyensis]|uniref:DinB family protein n=1 Tax=Belliella kenyensis TaxID=1472724 RepID=A0ABV8EF41_9BACT|nr:DinB family protein [Belliella kenyensis]MCH7401788.1 DinB family protein [Belliella kenyensis]MDN3604287.1 DinB family protein [Belliella kenyensis]